MYLGPLKLIISTYIFDKSTQRNDSLCPSSKSSGITSALMGKLVFETSPYFLSAPREID